MVFIHENAGATMIITLNTSHLLAILSKEGNKLEHAMKMASSRVWERHVDRQVDNTFQGSSKLTNHFSFLFCTSQFESSVCNKGIGKAWIRGKKKHPKNLQMGGSREIKPYAANKTWKCNSCVGFFYIRRFFCLSSWQNLHGKFCIVSLVSNNSFTRDRHTEGKQA